VADYIHAGATGTIVDPTRSPRTGLLYLGGERFARVARR
jgi:hypothetical protein